MIDYLILVLFDPLGISKPDWETDLQGVSYRWMGIKYKDRRHCEIWSAVFTERQMEAEKECLPKWWVKRPALLTSSSIRNIARREKTQVIGNKVMATRCGGAVIMPYRGDGAFGQYIIVMPDQDAVIAITSETGSMQGELDLIWQLLLPAMHNGKLPADKSAHDALKKKLASLALPVNKNNIVPSATALIAGKTFSIESNFQRIESMSFRFQNNIVNVNIKTDTASYVFNFGADDWQPGETTMHGPYLLTAAKNNLVGLPAFKVAGEYTWIDANTLELVLRYIESPHTQTFLCRFDGQNISIEVKRSFAADKTTLKGTVQ